MVVVVVVAVVAAVVAAAAVVVVVIVAAAAAAAGVDKTYFICIIVTLDSVSLFLSSSCELWSNMSCTAIIVIFILKNLVCAS